MPRHELTPEDIYGLEWLKYLLERTDKAVGHAIGDIEEVRTGDDFPQSFNSQIRRWESRLGQTEVLKIMNEVEINIGKREDYIMRCLTLQSGQLTPYQIWLEQQKVLEESQSKLK